MAVYFRCKSCGGEHPSPIAFGDKLSFETSTLTSNSFHCLKTQQMATYDKKDMFWKDESGTKQ